MLAKQVANTILDTLTENDDVAIVGLDARPLLNCSEYGELVTVQVSFLLGSHKLFLEIVGGVRLLLFWRLKL